MYLEHLFEKFKVVCNNAAPLFTASSIQSCCMLAGWNPFRYIATKKSVLLSTLQAARPVISFRVGLFPIEKKVVCTKLLFRTTTSF